MPQYINKSKQIYKFFHYFFPQFVKGVCDDQEITIPHPTANMTFSLNSSWSFLICCSELNLLYLAPTPTQMQMSSTETKKQYSLIK